MYITGAFGGPAILLRCDNTRRQRVTCRILRTRRGNKGTAVLRKSDRGKAGNATERTQVLARLDGVHSSVVANPTWEFMPGPRGLKRQISRPALTARTENIARTLGKRLFALKEGIAARRRVRLPECVLSVMRAEQCRPGQRSNNDFDVFDGDRLVGRILWHSDGPPRRSWSWGILLRERPRRRDHGYAATREVALENFKARWDKLQAVNCRFAT
jgi:hypothetical protein